jgi:hypothetical protein
MMLKSGGGRHRDGSRDGHTGKDESRCKSLTTACARAGQPPGHPPLLEAPAPHVCTAAREALGRADKTAKHERHSVFPATAPTKRRRAPALARA